ncbi:beta-lactamase family protein, partial [Rhodobacteraceae bacterium R_SAG2]|nr:beta-lactamase family protein [Rhodobacteraceae bacterium R_SAG2]
MTVNRLNRIRDWQHRYVDQKKYAGSAVLINRHGAELYYSEVGARNIEEDLAWTRETVARIYSMTKPITSVALMMLVERGLMHLDAPVSDFIPEFKEMQALVAGAEHIG